MSANKPLKNRCPTCDGTGKSLDGFGSSACATCWGSGWVTPVKNKQPKRNSNINMPTPTEVKDLIEKCGGTPTGGAALPDGSAFMTASFPLPKDHWIYKDHHEVPPMPMRMGTDDPQRQDMQAHITAATKYAVRACTMNGKDMDFDPDAMIQNMVVGMLGYFTTDGLSSDPSENGPPATG